MKAIFRIIFFLIIAALSTGCATIEYGEWPNTDLLSSLQLDLSNGEDIKRLLGEPTGRGKGRMPDFPGTADVWSYEYTRANGNRMNVSILLIFMINDIYQGHFWFVANDSIKTTM